MEMWECAATTVEPSTPYDRLSHQPMNGVTFEIFRNGASIGRYETKGQGEILLTGIEPGTYRAVEVDTGWEVFHG